MVPEVFKYTFVHLPAHEVASGSARAHAKMPFFLTHLHVVWSSSKSGETRNVGI